MSFKRLTKVICSITKGRENAYVSNVDLEFQFKKLVEYALSSRDDRRVDQEEFIHFSNISMMNISKLHM